MLTVLLLGRAERKLVGDRRPPVVIRERDTGKVHPAGHQVEASAPEQCFYDHHVGTGPRYGYDQLLGSRVSVQVDVRGPLRQRLTHFIGHRQREIGVVLRPDSDAQESGTGCVETERRRRSRSWQCPPGGDPAPPMQRAGPRAERGTRRASWSSGTWTCLEPPGFRIRCLEKVVRDADPVALRIHGLDDVVDRLARLRINLGKVDLARGCDRYAVGRL